MNGVLGSCWIVLYCYCYFTNVAVVLMNNEWILVLYLQKIWSGFMQSLFDALNF